MNRLTPYRGHRDLLSRLHDDFNRLLVPFDIHSEFDWPETSISEWVPRVDVKEEKDRYIINADLPGVKADNIDVSMENGVLTIKGSRESEVKEEKKNYLRVERSSGSFMRQLPLPETVDHDKISANYRDGVLELNLPKAKQNAGRKIEVKKG